MRFDRVRLAAVETCLPPRVVTSAEVETRLAPVYERLRLPTGRLEMMTGIRERRFWEPGTRPSTAAARAGALLLDGSPIPRTEIGVLIHASVSRDFLEPATASVVHDALGLSPACAMFDLGNACLGVLSAMGQVAMMIETGMLRAGLVVSGETAEPLYEATLRRILADKHLTRQSFKKHFASLTIGSGACAVLLVDETLAPDAPRLLGGAARTDSSAHHLCREDTETPRDPDAGGPLMATDSEALLHAGCALAARTWEATKDILDWTDETPDHVFTHQVGRAHQRLLFEALGLNPALDLATVDRFGNTGSAALPTALAVGMREKGILRGEAVALLGIGSGLASCMLGLEWG